MGDRNKPGIKLRAWRVHVVGYGDGSPVYAGSRGKAIAKVWGCDAFGHLTFKDFLKIVSAKTCEPGERFGEEIEVSGRPAFVVEVNRQYVRFVYPGGDVVLSSHPLDVTPVEARRGTSYYHAA